MSSFKVFITTLTISLCFCCAESIAATFTACYQSTCAVITAPDSVAPGEEFEIEVEGYIENATSWDTSAYMLLENAEWYYDSDHMLRYSGERLDAKGFNWGGSLVKKYTLNDLSENKVLTFVFGPRGRQHGYYDVAVEATIAVASPAISVAFDIKPQSCPNPLNINNQGLLSAAIVGSPVFDVRQVDPATIVLAGVSPIHSSFEDVTEPYYFLTDKVSEFDCTDAGPDGYMDLTVKFRAQDIYAALESLRGRPLLKGEVLTLDMTAALLDDGGQKPQITISGEDVIRINAKK